MLMLAIIAAGALTLQSAVADQLQASPIPKPQQHRVGETLDYSLHAVMSQSILGKDAFGRGVNQTSAPTNVKGHENIAITKTSIEGVTLHRLGTITAIVEGAKPVTKSAQGWTLVDSRGIVVRDSGKLGGLFLLPLPFLADGSINAGNALKIGDHWSARLGTKLYGMTAQPKMEYTVTGQRSVLGINVFTIEAVGAAPMKEPVMTATGEPLGYATGVAHVTAKADYDRDNRRLISLDLEVHDTLHYKGPTKRSAGSVRDNQRCLFALDTSSMVGGLHGAVGRDPASPVAPAPKR